MHKATEKNHGKTSPKPGEQARKAAGYTLEAAAGKLRLNPRYLRSIELHGGASLQLARRLANLYGCSGNVFIYPPGYLAQLAQGQRMAAKPSTPPSAAGADTDLARASRRYRPSRQPTLRLVK